jgi:hypothetical protein
VNITFRLLAGTPKDGASLDAQWAAVPQYLVQMFLHLPVPPFDIVDCDIQFASRDQSRCSAIASFKFVPGYCV